MPYERIDNLKIGTLIINIDESIGETLNPELQFRIEMRDTAKDDTLLTIFMPATSTCRELRAGAIMEAMNILDQTGHYCDSIYLNN